MTNEAPLPDDVEKSLSNVACGVTDYSDCTVLRAYIAALKVKYHNAVMDLCEVKEVSEQLNDKVTALEAENNRLRSLIERSVNFVSLYAETQKAGKFLEELKSALAQTDDTCLRTTMSEAELEREAGNCVQHLVMPKFERDLTRASIIELAKRCRG